MGGRMLLSVVYQYNNLLAHLVPTGTPAFLIPVIVVIERVRNVIRPATLAIRLAANIVAGHLLLTLLGSQGPLLGSVALAGLFCRFNSFTPSRSGSSMYSILCIYYF